jgi:hypothetical protein
VSAALQHLMHNLFPVLTEIHHPGLLRNYAHDLVSSLSAGWHGGSTIVLSYLTANSTHWNHVADIYVSLWEGQDLLLLLCALARCGTRLRTTIEEALDQVQKDFKEGNLLVLLAPACLKVVALMMDGISGRDGATYKRAAKAFLIIHKLLHRIPPQLVQSNVLRQFLEEQLMFHFNFDYVFMHHAKEPASHQFRSEVLAKFPCSAKNFFQFAYTLSDFPLSNFLYKYMGMFAIPLAMLIGVTDHRSQNVIQECLEFALASKANIS